MNDLPQAHGFEVVGRSAPCAIRRADGYSGQHALAVLLNAVEQRAFPGAGFAAMKSGRVVLQGSVGRFIYDDDSEGVTLSTIFDLASVTKVVATTAAAMLLFDRHQLNLQQPVVELLPEFGNADARRNRITVAMLLAHSSGLPAYVKLFQEAQDRSALLRLAFQVPLEAEPCSRAEYSDIGFILLGELLQRIAKESLADFCVREIFLPLGMNHTCFNPKQTMRSEIPPTRDDRDFRHRIIEGEVHDENASVMEGVSGHAGVFSNTTDLMKFAAFILGRGSKLVRPRTIELFTRRQTSPAGTSRALGWDTPSPPSQAGQYFSPNSFGHLGYTGTSLWIDAEREVAIALLTNRTWPDNQSHAIKKVRPAFHDALMKELLAIS